MLGTLGMSISVSSRSTSHYAASSSAPSLVSFLLAATGLQQLTAQAHGTWRSLHQSAWALSAAADVPAAPTASQTPGVEDLDLDLLSNPASAASPEAVASPMSSSAALPAHVLRDLRPPTQPYQLLPKQAQRPAATPALYTPWTPTRALQRRKHISKRMHFLVDVLEREQMERVQAARPVPSFRAGDILEVRLMVPEAERKVAVYRGVCIARYDKGLRSTFKIYNVFPDCGGVVQHLPLYMPDLLGIRVVGRIPAKQERLYYLLERQSSEYTFQTNVTAAT